MLLNLSVGAVFFADFQPFLAGHSLHFSRQKNISVAPQSARNSPRFKSNKTLYVDSLLFFKVKSSLYDGVGIFLKLRIKIHINVPLQLEFIFLSKKPLKSCFLIPATEQTTLQEKNQHLNLSLLKLALKNKKLLLCLHSQAHTKGRWISENSGADHTNSRPKKLGRKANTRQVEMVESNSLEIT